MITYFHNKRVMKNPSTINGTSQIIFSAYTGAIQVYIQTTNYIGVAMATGWGVRNTPITFVVSWGYGC